MPLDPMTAFTLGKTALGILGNYQTQEATRGAARKYSGALGRANALVADPASMYANDPGLLARRQIRMADVQAGQLARSGGLRGGAYGRQLMKEGAAFDSAALQDAVNMQLQMANAYAPQAQQYYSSGGGGGPFAAIAGPVSQGLSDFAWQQMMASYLKGNTAEGDMPTSNTNYFGMSRNSPYTRG